MHRLHNHLRALHHTGSQTENPVVIPEEPEEQLEVQQQEVPEADEEDVEEHFLLLHLELLLWLLGYDDWVLGLRSYMMYARK